jgi:hypothetical protein
MIRALLLPFAAVFVVALVRFFIASLGSANDASGNSRRVQMRLRLAGIIILALGFVAATAIYLAAAPVVERTNATRLGYTGLSDGDMILVGGRVNVYTAELREWFGGLWHGRKLAVTVALLSSVGCLVCFYLAHPRISFSTADPPRARQDGRGDDPPNP